MIKWFEKQVGPPCTKAVWEYKKMLFKINGLNRFFNKLRSSFTEPKTWQGRLGSNLHILGFECGNVFDIKRLQFRLGSFCNSCGVACVYLNNVQLLR